MVAPKGLNSPENPSDAERYPMSKLPEPIQHLPKLTFGANQVVIEESEGTGRLVFLASGSVQVLKDGVPLASVSERGAVFGDMAVLLESPPTATVLTLEASEFWVAEDPKAFLGTHSDVMYYVAKILARRLDSLNRYLVDVKSQFQDHDDHLGMLDEVLGTLMNKHPRDIEDRSFTDP